MGCCMRVEATSRFNNAFNGTRRTQGISVIFVTFGNSTFDFHRLVYRIKTAQAHPLFAGTEWIIQAGSNLHWRDAAKTFSREDQLRYIAQADAVVSHCGVGTLLDCWRAGHKPIVLPRLKSHAEHISDHQVQLFTALMASYRIFAMPPEPEKLFEVVEHARTGRPWSFPTDHHLADVVAEQIEELLA